MSAEELEKKENDLSFRPVFSSPLELAGMAEASRKDKTSLLQSQI